jgi:hypothetical protein
VARERYPLTVWIDHLLVQRDEARRALGVALRRVEECRTEVEGIESARERSWEETRRATSGVDGGSSVPTVFGLLQAHRHREALAHRLAEERSTLDGRERRAHAARVHLAEVEDELRNHERRRERWLAERRREALRLEERDAQEVASARHVRVRHAEARHAHRR